MESQFPEGRIDGCTQRELQSVSIIDVTPDECKTALGSRIDQFFEDDTRGEWTFEVTLEFSHSCSALGLSCWVRLPR